MMGCDNPSWRYRLHFPTHIQQLQQPKFEQALHTACQVLLPSLTQAKTPSATVILLGPSSSGKSLLSRFLIDTLEPKVTSSTGGQLVVINLDGLIHSTPTRAWCHVAQSLLVWHKAACHGTSRIDSRKYYDPDKLETAVNSDDDSSVISHLQDAVMPALDHIRKTKSALLLVLDQLHRFTSSDPLSQTVLYSLLNLLQDRSLHAGCIAQTPIFDITDLLEKRVSSRLSHRKIVLPLIDSYNEVHDFLFSALVTNSKTLLDKSGARIGSIDRIRSAGRKQPSTLPDPPLSKIDALSEVSRVVLSDSRFKESVEGYLTRSRVVAPILWALDAALSLAIPHDSEQVNLSFAIERAVEIIDDSLRTRDFTEDLLTSLTVLQLQLVVALCKIEHARASEAAKRKRDGDGIGTKSARVVFEDVYKEYLSIGRMDDGCLAERDVSQNVVDRPVAERAWELLVEGGVVTRTGTGPRDARSVVCSMGKSRVDAAVGNHPESSAVMKNWAKRNALR